MVVSSLAPALGHAFARGDARMLAAVCSALGTKWVVLADDAAAQERGSTPAPQPSQHCPYCAPAQPTLAMGPAPVHPVEPIQLSFKLPALRPGVPLAPTPRCNAQPRAPPVTA